VAGVGFKNSDVMKRLRGKKGTKVDVAILRKGEPHRWTSPSRATRSPSTVWKPPTWPTPGVGYIKVSRFSATTMKEFREKLTELKEAKGMKDLILDLQGNGGGYLRTAIDMADEFLGDRKLVVYTEGRTSPREDTYCHQGGTASKRPFGRAGG
jgi:carboxyl-terminal processing protease